MKTLLIMRHAKSAYPPQIRDDFDRPLNKRGQGDLPRLNRLLRRFGPEPELILSSPAERARQTTEGLGLDAPVRYIEGLYLAAVAALEEAAATAPPACQSLLLVGHNPGLEEWLERLTGGHLRMPTAAVAAVQLHLDHWTDLPGRGRSFRMVCRAPALAGLWRMRSSSDADQNFTRG